MTFPKFTSAQVLMAGKVAVFAGAAALAWTGKLTGEMLQLAETMLIALALPHAAALLAKKPTTVADVVTDAETVAEDVKTPAATPAAKA